MNEHLVVKDLVHGAQQHHLLDVVACLGEGVWIVAVVHLDDVLLDDRPFVEVVGDEVGGRPDDLHAAAEGLVVGLGSHERREERVMDVDEFAQWIVADEAWREDAHVLGEDHVVRAARVYGFHDFDFLLLARIVGILVALKRHIEFLGERAQILMVADHFHDVGVERA